MKVVLLTTDTLHHLYFSAMLSETDCLSGIVLEAPPRGPTFSTFHPFEVVRDEYEKEYFFKEDIPKFSTLTQTHTTSSVNDLVTQGWISQIRPELIIVFGTRRLLPETIVIPSQACLNLHGGNPEKYRGLDSHYWTIYHSDFENLITTLHHVDLNYDSGPIVCSEAIEISQNMDIHQLRAANTESCLRLFTETLAILGDGRDIPSAPQGEEGRYYSAMPSALKSDCQKKFYSYTQRRDCARREIDRI
ncbi:MAG: hypothetical protein HOH43_26780 [Candidatus Latescibacteria bacterium]|jgi:methionyl-tRNA formyltransferase|nr:hypothetical protein [Candidatus Latescibacterota bacterium]